MASVKDIPRNNSGLPADRKPGEGMTGVSPADALSLKGSGYDQKWDSSKTIPPMTGVISKWSGNGSW